MATKSSALAVVSTVLFLALAGCQSTAPAPSCSGQGCEATKDHTPTSGPPAVTPDPPIVGQNPTDPVLVRFENCTSFSAIIAVQASAVDPFVPDAFDILLLGPDASELGFLDQRCSRVTFGTNVILDYYEVSVHAAVEPKDESWGTTGSTNGYVLFQISSLTDHLPDLPGLEAVINASIVHETDALGPSELRITTVDTPLIHLISKYKPSGDGTNEGLGGSMNIWYGIGPFTRAHEEATYKSKQGIHPWTLDVEGEIEKFFPAATNSGVGKDYFDISQTHEFLEVQ